MKARLSRNLSIDKPTTIYRNVAVFLYCQWLSMTVFGGSLTYNIPAQSLNDALLKFAEQSSLTLIVSSDQVRNIDVAALIGDYSIEQGLTRLLQDTGLAFRFTDSDTVVLFAQESPVLPHSPSLSDVSASRPSLPVRIMTPLVITGKMPADEFLQKDSGHSYAVTHTRSATRTLTPVKQIPQSIQTLPKSLLLDQRNLTISESVRNVSGVNVSPVLISPSFDFTRIRGFRGEQTVDGFTQYYNPGDRESLVNVASIDVLKGSNALLYSGGSGSPAGGLINIVSKRPHHEAAAELGIRYGSYQYYQPWLDINQPLNDNILFRFSGEYTRSESHVDVLQTQRYNLNPSLTLTDNVATQLTLYGKMSRWQQQDYQGLPATGALDGSFSVDRELFVGSDEVPDTRAAFSGVWGDFSHQINDVWSVNVKARYAESEFDQKVQSLFGADGLQADRPLSKPSSWALLNTVLFQEQQEVSVISNVLARFNARGIEHKVLIGADYSRYADQGFIDASPAPIQIVDLREPFFSIPFQAPGSGQNNVFVTNETYGAYVQWQSEWYERVHLLGGLRLGHVGIDYDNRSPGFEVKEMTDTTRILGRLGAVVDLTDEISVFAGFSEGMRGQPFVNFVSAPQPELSRQLEAGFKFDFKSGLSGQVVVYQIDLDQVAVRDNTDALRRSVTHGKQRSQGVEADLVWQVTDNLNVLTSFAYIDPETVNNSENFIIPAIVGIPDYSGRLWANYRFPHPLLKHLSIGAGVYAQSEAPLDVEGISAAPAFYTLDAAIQYSTDRFTLALTGKNLSDSDHFEYLNYFRGRVAPSQPASFYLDISWRY